MELGFDKSCEVQWGGFQPGKQTDLNSADESSSYLVPDHTASWLPNLTLGAWYPGSWFGAP